MATNTQKRTLRRQSKKTWVVLVVLLLGIVFSFLYFNGFRVGGSGVSSPASIELSIPYSGVDVYVDGSKKKTTSKDSETIVLDGLSANTHSIVLSKNGYWPWQKDVALTGGEKRELNPFFISKTVSGSMITTADPEYYSIKALVSRAVVPGERKQLHSPNGKVAVWVTDKTLYAMTLVGAEDSPSYLCPNDLCGNPVKIIAFTSNPRSLEFYKDRSDVVLVAIDTMVGALELDMLGTQNFQPVFNGGTPRFTKSATGSLFVDDGKTLSEVAI